MRKYSLNRLVISTTELRYRQCLLDEASAVALSLRCPNCEASLATNAAGPSSTNPFYNSAGSAILAHYTNEGGVEPELDILPAITEEAYLDSNPETRPARAFQLMCAEGDVDGIVELLEALDEDQDVDVTSLLRYQDPLSNMRSGLHLAVEKGQLDIALLLLWLCSTAPSEAFPGAARQMAEGLGLDRLPVGANGDIRALQDGRGFTAADLARQLQGPWGSFLDSGILTP